MKNNGVSADIFIQSTVEHSDFRNWEEVDFTARRFSFKSSLSNSTTSGDSSKNNILNSVNIIWTQKLIMQWMARNVFNEGFIQFISCMLVDKIESSDAETYWAYIVKFPKNLIGIQFDEAWFIYNRINQVQDFKNNEFRFLLFGIVKSSIDSDETTDQIILSPLKHVISETDYALILCNKEEMLPIFEKNTFEDTVHLLKLKYFHGTIQSPKKSNQRRTVKDRRLGFITNIQPTISIDEESSSSISHESLLESTFNDNFEMRLGELDSRRSNSEMFKTQRLCLIKDHDDFDNSINNGKFYPIIDSSMRKLLKSKFSYKMLLESRYSDISINNMSEFISNHIIIWGYNRGWNQFIESIREESDIPIVIISGTSKLADIMSITCMYPNVFHFNGDPLNIEHLKNANIIEAKHVIIPSKAEEDISGNDWNAVLKANIIKQNWPEVKISVEFTSNTKAWLIENLLDYGKDFYSKESTSTYTNKGYINGKIFSSVLLTRMSAMKSLRKYSYEAITSCLKHVFSDSNIITIEIPERLKCKEVDLTYGKVREFLLFNSKINLIALGVYATNIEEVPNYYRTRTPPRRAFNTTINPDESMVDSDDEYNFRKSSIAIGKI